MPAEIQDLTKWIPEIAGAIAAVSAVLFLYLRTNGRKHTQDSSNLASDGGRARLRILEARTDDLSGTNYEIFQKLNAHGELLAKIDERTENQGKLLESQAELFGKLPCLDPRNSCNVTVNPSKEA